MLFGDPAQLAPVGQSGDMVFDRLAPEQTLRLARVHRQAAGNPILDLAHALGDPELEFPAFERMVRAGGGAGRPGGGQPAGGAGADGAGPGAGLAQHDPGAADPRLPHRPRAPEESLLPGEPLICDGIEVPVAHRWRRIDLEARGLIKGAQAIYLGEGRRHGFSRLYVVGAEDPRVSVATIIQIEAPDREEPVIPSPANMGVSFLHGAAVTIHKAQGSQWPEVQVFAPDLFAASRSGRTEAGTALWKRLAYVAITRAEERLHWVTRAMLGRPTEPLGTADLAEPAPTLALVMRPG